MDQPNFLNVDLEIVSDSPDMLEFGTALESSVVVVQSHPAEGGYRVVLELGEEHDNPNEVINGLCALIENLEGKRKLLWQHASSRLFDVGYDQNQEQPGTHFRIGGDSLRRIAALNADLGISVYRRKTE